jgi:hypothetical protein
MPALEAGREKLWLTTAELELTGRDVVGFVVTRSLGNMSEEDLGPVPRDARVKWFRIFRLGVRRTGIATV